jgi:hypothetical protein
MIIYMPKIEIDYSNTIIYKITCKDPNILDVYVGHTTNFVQRKHAHKQSCINNKSSNHKCKLYEVIRNNGGWINWDMEIIHFCNCADHYEARKKEQEYFELLKATLNSLEPFPKPKVKMANEIFFCEKCNIKCDNAKLLDIHNQTKKHNRIKDTNSIKDEQFCCTTCDLITSSKKDYSKHLLTSKHINAMKINESHAQPISNTCSCGKHYKDRSGLWRHQKKCTTLIEEAEAAAKKTELENTMSNIDMNVIITFMKDTIEFKQLMIEQSKIIMELAEKMGIKSVELK